MAFTTPILVPTSTTGPSNSAVRFAIPAASSSLAQWQTTAGAAGMPFPAGTLSGLKVRLPAALTGVQTWAFTLNVNGTDTAITCTVDSSGLIATDSTHSVAINDGDLVCLKSAPSGTPTAQTNIQFSFLHVAAGSSGVLVAGTNGSAVSGTPANGCLGRYSTSGTTLANATGVMPCAGTISTVWFAVSVAPGTGTSRTVTLVKNGVDTALTIAISNAAKSATFTPGSAVSFAAGDTVSLRFDTTTTVAAVNLASFLWTPTNAREVPLLGSNASAISTSVTSYSVIEGNSATTETTESDTPAIVPAAMRLTTFRQDIGAPGSGKSRTATVRINSADSAAVALVSNVATNTTWTGDIGLAANDLIDVSNVPSGTPATANTAQYGAVVKVSATFNDTAAETLTAADALSSTAAFPNTISAALTATDTETSTATFGSTISEALTSSDALAAGLAMPVSFNEVLSSADGFVTAATIPAAFTESATAAYALLGQLTVETALSEASTLLDDLTSDLAFNISFSEAVNADYTVIGDVLVILLGRPNSDILVQLSPRLEVSLPARQIITIVDDENTAVLPGRISVGG